jgi:hypothetical protein
MDRGQLVLGRSAPERDPAWWLFGGPNLQLVHTNLQLPGAEQAWGASEKHVTSRKSKCAAVTSETSLRHAGSFGDLRRPKQAPAASFQTRQALLPLSIGSHCITLHCMAARLHRGEVQGKVAVSSRYAVVS